MSALQDSHDTASTAESLTRGQFQVLRKAVAKTMIDACRDESLLEPFAEQAFGTTVGAKQKQLRSWKKRLQ